MGLIPEDVISQVIDRNDIVDVISSYVPLKQGGKYFKAPCPFHNEKTPSFVVNPDKQIFNCFGCSVGGNVISFIMRQERMEFPEAVRFLAQRVNIEIVEDRQESSQVKNQRQGLFDINGLAVEYFHNNLLFNKSQKAQDVREYLKKRGVSLDSVKQFKLGLAEDLWDGLYGHLKGKNISDAIMSQAGLIIQREKSSGYYDRFRNRVIFPIFDSRSQARAFGARALDDNPAKYINSPETMIYTKGHHVYAFDLAKPEIIKSDSVIIVEGYMDCIIPWQAGVRNVVASLGTALTVEQIRLLRRYTKNVVMLFDTDQAGISAMLRSLDILIEEDMVVKVVTLEKGYDPDSYINKYGVDAFQEKVASSKTLFDYKLDMLLAQHDSSTIEGKAKISGEMLPTLDKFNNQVIRYGYLDQLSNRLGISKEALLVELKRVKQTQRRKGEHLTNEHRQFADSQPRVVEREMLRLLLHQDEYVGLTKTEISINDFQDVKVRQIMSQLYDLFDKGESLSGTNLLSQFESGDLQNIISQLLADSPKEGDVARMHRDFVNRMKKDKVKSQTKVLLDRIREAEHSGDQKELEELKKAFNELIKH